ncbi:Stk1 family PASTA domain-containing Ser/Thr kinase [Salinispora fenicalii]|uniref:Stk1 family PASTA domain-containing Ser/Thr kinase n=1 Tax=Salinispora fenicalii TaxID=1137263 RepID=UPI000485EEBB|nr:Stk1 family PASTA domain-containing Ser/Thr kinase [Salinispora fenicalii]
MSDDRTPAADGPDDETRPLPADQTAPLPPADQTAPLPPTDQTAPLPPTGGPAAWLGRAGVPPPRPPEYQEATGWYGEPNGRRWWSPILWGVIVLLLAAFGTGLWLALGAGDDEQVTPDSSPSATAPSATAPSASPIPTSATPTATAPTTTAPTTTAPTTTAPTTTAPTTPSPTGEPGEVPMPPVVNRPLTTAQVILDQAGLAYRVRYRTSNQPSGIVIGTEPRAGALVPEGAVVVLVVSSPGSSPERPTPTPTPEPTPTS